MIFARYHATLSQESRHKYTHDTRVYQRHDDCCKFVIATQQLPLHLTFLFRSALRRGADVRYLRYNACCKHMLIYAEYVGSIITTISHLIRHRPYLVCKSDYVHDRLVLLQGRGNL